MTKPPFQFSLPLDNISDDSSSGSNQPERRTSIGKSKVTYVQTRSILTKASGFISEFDFTLNPYSGCTFGCSYCYASFFVRDQMKQDTWGQWVQVKENALLLLRRKRKIPLNNKTVYMSSVTDPYQPIERDLELTRSILEELVSYHRPRLVIQTRSPIVVRDIDLLKRFDRVQVNMTITTDDEKIRKIFEPTCSSIKARFDAITQIRQAGIPACITITPVLPITEPETFAKRLLASGVQKFVIQSIHTTRGKFAAGTPENAQRLFEECNWTMGAYRQTLSVIKHHIPNIREGKEGFTPI